MMNLQQQESPQEAIFVTRGLYMAAAENLYRMQFLLSLFRLGPQEV